MGDEKTLIVAKEHIAKAIGMTKIAEKRGWLNYFKLANIHSKLQALDSWLRKRLRYCIWHHWKRPERKRKNLMRLGVNPKDAYAWIRTRMGDWRVAQSPILKTTITLARLKKRGYIATLELYHQTRSK